MTIQINPRLDGVFLVGVKVIAKRDDKLYKLLTLLYHELNRI